MSNETVRSFCNCCQQDTQQDVLWQKCVREEIPDGTVLEHSIEVLACRGCHECGFVEKTRKFNPVIALDEQGTLVNIEYTPAKQWRRPPDWLDELEDIDPDLKGLLDEVYSAAHDKQIRLLSMGVRAALDRTMTIILNGDAGSFEQKLMGMVEKGHLTEKQKSNLSVVIDAGSASTHRGFKPPRELVVEMLVVMEGVIREYYFTGPMLQTAKTLIPPRPHIKPK